MTTMVLIDISRGISKPLPIINQTQISSLNIMKFALYLIVELFSIVLEWFYLLFTTLISRA